MTDALLEAKRDAALVALVEMYPAPWNPRTITEQRLRDLRISMDADPSHLWARPLMIREDGMIIGGNKRWEAASLEPPYESLPAVLMAGLSEEEAQVIALRDNNGYGVWDDPQVASILSGLDRSRVDLTLTGFTDVSITDLLRRYQTAPVTPQQEIAPPARKTRPKSKRGEVYELGPHRLICGDATSADDAVALMGPERASLLVTSPPYGDARDYDTDSDSDMAPAKLARFLSVYAEHADVLAVNLGILREQHAVIPYWDAYNAAAVEAGLKLLAWNVWDRGEAGTIGQATAMFPVHHEFVFVYGERPVKLNATQANKHAGGGSGAHTVRAKDGTLSRPRKVTVRDYSALGSVLHAPPHKGPSAGDHPAVFPLVLPETYIEAATLRGDVVVDPFGGSGTTLIAAARTGRRARLCEISPVYADCIRERWAKYEQESQS